jgi:hypothetical protein
MQKFIDISNLSTSTKQTHNKLDDTSKLSLTLAVQSQSQDLVDDIHMTHIKAVMRVVGPCDFFILKVFSPLFLTPVVSQA